MNSNLLHFDTAESFLGKSNKRYFSSGYKRIKHHFEDVLVAGERLIGVLNIEWSNIWAQKEGVSLSPHLGSLEFYVIAAQLSELYLEIIDNFSKRDIENTWISHFKIKAGTEAETVLRQEECMCSKIATTVDANNGILKSSFEVKIGKCVVNLTLDHKPCLSHSRISVNKIREMKDRVAFSYFTTGYKVPIYRIFNINLDTQTRIATAEIEVLNQEFLNDFRGLGRKYQPCFSYTDAILIVGQLSQILLFSLDGLTRDRASNLWMRQIESKYHQPLGDRFTIELRADDFKILKLNENNFRTSTLHLNCSDQMTAQLKFAYQL